LGAKVNKARAFKTRVGTLAVVVALGLGSLAGTGVIDAAPAGAAVSNTQHLLPAFGAEGVTFQCGPDNAYGCTPGYTGSNVPAYMWDAYGCDNGASGCPDTPHNCTLYAAYKLNQIGVVPNWWDDPTNWATQAATRGERVDQSPAVGSFAQWNLGKGHVAYVEGVDATGITLTMDWWSSAVQTPLWPNGYTSRVRIARTSPAYPDNFIHYEDVTPTASFTAVPTTGPAPFSVQFNDTSTGIPTSWSWTFGDGATSTQKNPSHLYTVAGTYTAKLTVTNFVGSTSSTTTITVKPPVALPGGYVLDGYGGLARFRVGTGPNPPAVSGGPYWPGWDIARDVALLSNGSGGYELDAWGGLHAFRVGAGAQPPSVRGAAYWVGWDIARGIAILPNGTGGYMVDGFGGIHPFALGSNPMPPAVIGNPYWNGNDKVRGITITPDGQGGYVVDKTGKLWKFKIGAGGTYPPTANNVSIVSAVSMQGVSIVAYGTGGFTVDGFGGPHPFGIGVNAKPPAASGGPYWPGWDIARGVAMLTS
jgi:PKD repeat protein